MHLNPLHPGIAPHFSELKQRFSERLALGLTSRYLELKDIVDALPFCPSARYGLENGIPTVHGTLSTTEKTILLESLKKLGPWRKGPWQFFETVIDAEWRSDVKFDRLAPHLDLQGKTVMDIGGGNGYFLYRLHAYGPKWVICADPTLQFWAQFEAFQTYAACPTVGFLPFGFQDLDVYQNTLDVAVCMGVLYHHPNPFELLKKVKQLLKKGGTLFLETLVYDHADAVALCPYPTYAGMKNVYFIPTPTTLTQWCKTSGFEEISVVDQTYTTSEEQRATPWSSPVSLVDHLHSENPNLTREGYPAPLRLLLTMTRA